MRFYAASALAVFLFVRAGAQTGPTTGPGGAAATDTGTGIVTTDDSGGNQDEAMLLVRHGAKLKAVGAVVAKDPDKYRDPGALGALIREMYPQEATNPKFQNAFANQILSQMPPPQNKPKVDNPINKTDPAVPAVPHQLPPAVTPGVPTYAEDYLRSIPNQPWVNERVGRRALERNDFETAYQDYTKALEAGDTRPEVYLGYGVSALQLKDYATAAKAAAILLQSNPKNPDALALYHASAGRTSQVTLPTTAAFGAMKTPESLAGAGAPPEKFAPPAGFATGGYNAPAMTPEQVAAAAIAQAKAAGPDAATRSASITRDAATALRVKDYPTAHQLASQAIVLNNSNVQALNFRAIASNKMAHYNDAVTDASAALALAPGNAAVLQTRAWAFAKSGNYQSALLDAEATLARNPSDPYAYQNKAFALAGLKDRAGALDALRRSAAIDPRFQNQLERALQMPQDQDMTLLFDDGYTSQAGAASAAPPVPQTGRRFARLALLSAMGGILIALGILHVVSASWREKVNMTIRRVLASSDSAGSDTAVATPLPQSPGGAFWLQYEVVKEIGLGGMGVVYEAMDRSLERRVAVKKMRDEIRIDPHERRRFVNEAKLVAQLHHPNIVDIYAIVEEGQEVYLVFEYVTGQTLYDKIKSEGPMSLEAARHVIAATADAVEHAHAAQIVHRDLKPSNIMITDDGRVKVMDFGVARQAKDAITKMSMTNTVVGTPPYMAPEQEQGTVRRESDVFALGVVLYEMLTGHLPFSGNGAAMLLNKLNGKHIPPSQRNPNLPAGLDEVIAKALVPDPDKRYPNPSALVAALDGVISARS